MTGDRPFRGLGVLVSKDELVLTDVLIKEIMRAVYQLMDLRLSKEESERLSLAGRLQLVSLHQPDFDLVTGAGPVNISRYLGKHILGIDEDTHVRVQLTTRFLHAKKGDGPWDGEVYACAWYG